MQEKIIKIIGEAAIASPLLFIAIPTKTYFALILGILLMIFLKRLYKYEFHFDDENQKWCLISSYTILILIIALFYFTRNYYVIFIFSVLVNLASSKIGFLYLNYLKLKEIKPFYDKLKEKYERVDFSLMTTEEIYETCRLNSISIKTAHRLVKFYIGGLTYEQIANEEENCYISVEAIRNCFHRARNKLKYPE